MKVKYAVFFQPVGLPMGGQTINQDASQKVVPDTLHDVTVEHPWVKVVHRVTGDTRLISIYNLNYVRPYEPVTEAADSTGAASVPETNKKPRGKNSVAADKLPGTESVPS